MGPFRFDAPPAMISAENPMGTDGFEFVEFAHLDSGKLGALFELMGFSAVARHPSQNVTLYRQGDVNYVVNAEPGGFAAEFATRHGPSACAMGFHVVDAGHAFDRAIAMGAKPARGEARSAALNLPAIEGVGGALIYFVDRYGDKGSIWDEFAWIEKRDLAPVGVGLQCIATSHTMFFAAAWMSGRTGTRPCSTFVRSDSSTSKANSPDCVRAP